MNTALCQSYSQTYFSIIWIDFYGFYISLPTHKAVWIWRMRSQFTKIPILAIKNHKSLLIQYMSWRLYFHLSCACPQNLVLVTVPKTKCLSSYLMLLSSPLLRWSLLLLNECFQHAACYMLSDCTGLSRWRYLIQKVNKASIPNDFLLSYTRV